MKFFYLALSIVFSLQMISITIKLMFNLYEFLSSLFGMSPFALMTAALNLFYTKTYLLITLFTF